METINLYKVLLALSSAIDLAEDSMYYDSDSDSRHRFQNHSRRTCYVAVGIAKKISTDDKFIEKVYISSIIHDIGITEDITSSHLDKEFIAQHSVEGFKLASRLPINKEIPEILKFHHENYDGSGFFNLEGDEIPLISQIIRLADTFEILYNESIPNYLQRDRIIDQLEKNRNILFSPKIVDLFIEVQSKDYFWWDVENIGAIPEIMNYIRPNLIKKVSLHDIRNIAIVFSDIIDSRSSFTYMHSVNLANLVLLVGNSLNMDPTRMMKLEIAALLHDIGKLAVPSSILNKEGKLTKTERDIMNSHTYYTRVVLSKIEDFEDVTNWAANHHEKLNGSGYPIGLISSDLSLEERIIAVCDIYEALTAVRPYKKGLSRDEAMKMLDNMVNIGELCGESLELLKKVI